MIGKPNANALQGLAVGGPGVIVAVAILLSLGLQAAGVFPFEPAGQMTLSEAAALESEADIVRLLRTGASPNDPAWVRRTRIRAVHAALTPLEAAMTARHVSVMTLLVDNGAVLDARNLPALWCLAASQRNHDALGWLRSRGGAEPPSGCDAVRFPRIRR
ncbi:MAG: hypothetical protein ABL971_01470 [Vicinamibacterales bacterium]